MFNQKTPIANRPCAQRLEPRILLATIAPDLDFGQLGEASIGGNLLVAPQAGGKVLAVDDTKATRLNADGSIDGSFNDGGALANAGLDMIHAAISGSRLVTAGVAENNTIALLATRLSNGTLDTSYGTGGIATIAPTPAVPGSTVVSVSLGSISATPDGGLLVNSLQQLQPSARAIVIYKLDSDGQLDTGFGDDGVIVLDEDLIGTSAYAFNATLTVAPDGKMFVHRKDVLSRFSAAGVLDTTFGDQGNRDIDDLNLIGFSHFSTMVAQADGTILISVDDATDLFMLGRIVRLTPAGNLDTTFGDGEEASPGNLNGPSFIRDFAVDSAGRIVGIAGDAVLFRFTPDGDLDTTFDDDGLATLLRDVDDAAITMDASDRVIVGEEGRVTRFTERDRVVLRPDGLLRVDGTEDEDTLEASISGNDLTVTLNGDDFTFAAADVAEMSIFMGVGDNDVELSVDLDATIITGRDHDSIVTGNGSNHIETGEGGNTVVSGNGHDVIIADSFAIITSNAGNDDIRILGSQEFFVQEVTVNAGDGDDQIRFEEHDWAHEWTVDAGSGNDLIVTANAESTIRGQDGNDTIFGGNAGELLIGGAGNDSILGEEGMDRIDGGEGNDFIDAGGSFDRAFGGPGNDTIRGGNEADFLHGEVGNDIVQGGSGADTLRGGDGADQMNGDDGNDTLQGQAGNDSMSGSAGNDLLQGSIGNDLLDGGLGADTLLGEGGVDKLLGNGGNDRLYGGDELDRLYGQDGDDLLFGGNGNDLLNGGAGFDILRGESGNDSFVSDDGVRDSVLGHDGRDIANADRFDVLREIEVRRR